MVEFKKENFYILRVDTGKNRMYLEYLGFWQSPEEVPDYLEHCKKATALLKEGFGMLITFKDKKPPKLAVQKMHKETHKIWMDHGLKKGALVFKTGKVLQNFVVSVLTKLTGAASNVKIKTFSTEAEGEAWLDADK